jgi:Zn finger protein HypA/HybF involved in hydrogenase expression
MTSVIPTNHIRLNISLNKNQPNNACNNHIRTLERLSMQLICDKCESILTVKKKFDAVLVTVGRNVDEEYWRDFT